MKNIRKGERFTSSNLICLRPASGKSASMWFKYLGKKSKRNYQAGKPI